MVQGKAHVLLRWGNWNVYGAIVRNPDTIYDEEIYIQGVSGAIVGNSDTIYDEVTTQAFSAQQSKNAAKNTGHYNLA